MYKNVFFEVQQINSSCIQLILSGGLEDISILYFNKVRHKGSDPHQPLVPGVDDSVEHGLVEQAVTHPLRDDDVYMIHWKLHLLHLTLYNAHNWNKNRSHRIRDSDVPTQLMCVSNITSVCWGV